MYLSIQFFYFLFFCTNFNPTVAQDSKLLLFTFHYKLDNLLNWKSHLLDSLILFSLGLINDQKEQLAWSQPVQVGFWEFFSRNFYYYFLFFFKKKHDYLFLLINNWNFSLLIIWISGADDKYLHARKSFHNFFGFFGNYFIFI